MVAPRARAASSSSSTSTQAPSPMTKPARVASKGREARGGYSSSAASPRIAQKPARISGWMHASVPPASTASACPRRMISAASPTAVEPVEAGILHRLLGRCHREQDVAVEAAGVLRRDDRRRLEVLHLGRDADGE